MPNKYNGGYAVFKTSKDFTVIALIGLVGRNVPTQDL